MHTESIMKKLKNINIGKLLAAILLSQMAGIIGSAFTISAIPTWYADLIKPSFSPPNWIFGPVWTTLYTLMGISLYLVWNTKLKEKSKLAWKKESLNIFYAQLILNTLWSIIFFGIKNPELAFVGILLMWALIAATIFKFYRISKASAYLLVPYLLWVSFATLLNFAIAYLN